ncbi:MAG: MFS transporter, partial [Aeromicrobium sp.]
MNPVDTALPSRRGRLLVVICIVALALNLRVAVGSLGVLIPEVRDHLGLSLTITGLLTTLPVLCFSAFGAGANTVVRSVGIHRTALISLFLITTGLLVRASATSAPVFVAFTALALAGAAIGNVILPPLAKLHFPDHLGAVSAAYGAALMTGATIGSAVTVPLSHLLNGWRGGLAIWAALSALTFVLWLRLARHDVKVDASSTSYGHLVTARSPLAWVMAAFFGIQSAQAYAQFGWLPAILTDSGMSGGRAGLMLGILSSIGIPMTLALPRIMNRVGDRPVLPFVFGTLSFIGWMGVLLWPTALTVVWMVLLGMGGTAFT